MERLERKEKEFKVRRADILKQAEKIFADRGFYNVTMAEIASASGFSSGSLYLYFTGKEDLYSSMIMGKLDLMYDQIKAKVNAASGVYEKIETIIAAHFQFVENNADFCRLFMRGENAAPSDVMTLLRRKILHDYSQYLTFIEKELNRGIKKGLLRALPARDMAKVLFGLVRLSSLHWLIFSQKESLSSQKDFLLDVFLRGVQQNEK